METIYFKKPIVVNTYSIYIKDIKPKGFAVVEIDGYVTEKAVEQTKQILDDPARCQKMVAHNYELGKQYFSYTVLERTLRYYMIEHNWLAPQ